MEITSEQNGNARRLHLQGELTIYSAMAVKEALLDGLAEGPELVLELSGVTEMDTAGVQLLIVAVREAANSGKRLSLQGCSPAVRGLIELYDLAGWFGESLASPLFDERIREEAGL